MSFVEAELIEFIIRQLRRISYMWPPRSTAKKQARIRRGVYRCARCDDEFNWKDVQVDHIEPVINPKYGWEDYNTYIDRLFCSEEGFQLLCKPCHAKKTKKENKLRT